VSGGGPSGGRRFGGGSGLQPVSVQAVQRQNIRVMVNAIGSLAAFNTATVRAQVSGVLQQLDFKEGQQVKVGQSLARIDPRAFQATLNQVEGPSKPTKARSTAPTCNSATPESSHRLPDVSD
jgi:multidrug efflux system membrane fusion protein